MKWAAEMGAGEIMPLTGFIEPGPNIHVLIKDDTHRLVGDNIS
jgi:hypothetical protein